MSLAGNRARYVAPVTDRGGSGAARAAVSARAPAGAGRADTRLRPGGPRDLDGMNRVVERAVGSWNLPERVRRLSLPLYRYTALDLEHLAVWVAERAGEVVGIAAWEAADPAEAPPGRSALLLHGLYVDPAQHGQGVGRRLLHAALAAGRAGGFDGVLVKAQAQAVGFFEACGLERLAVVKPERDYPNRFWAAVRSP